MKPWRELLKTITVTQIEEQIADLKDRIRTDQEEIIYLTILRRGLLASREFLKITDRKTKEIIDDAIKEANRGMMGYTSVKTDGEGSIGAG